MLRLSYAQPQHDTCRSYGRAAEPLVRRGRTWPDASRRPQAGAGTTTWTPSAPGTLPSRTPEVSWARRKLLPTPCGAAERPDTSERSESRDGQRRIARTRMHARTFLDVHTQMHTYLHTRRPTSLHFTHGVGAKIKGCA